MARWGLIAAAKEIDRIGVFLVLALAAFAVAGAYAALHFGWFRSPWEMAVWLFVGLALIAAGFGIQSSSPPRNTNVYGAAKPATELEAQTAARGDRATPALHDRAFPD